MCFPVIYEPEEGLAERQMPEEEVVRRYVELEQARRYLQAEEERAEPTGEATHWAQLDTKNMKVVELRNELAARGQPSKGIKNQLQARLQKCLQSEEVCTVQYFVMTDHYKLFVLGG